MKIIYIIISFFVVFLNNVNAQIRVKADGKVKIGAGTLEPGSTLEVQEYNKTTELRIFALSPNIARIWASNSLYAYGFGTDASGVGHIFKNMNSPSSIMTFNTMGDFGVGRTPSYKFDVNGVVRANTLICPSDEKYKSNIGVISHQASNLFKLKSVSYYLKNFDSKTSNDVDEIALEIFGGVVKNKDSQVPRIHYGFIAQEVREIYPELVYEDAEGLLGIDYVSFIPLLVAELKQQSEVIEELKKEIEMLKIVNGYTDVTKNSEYGGELYQNYPNPFDKSTIIKFRLPKDLNSATIYLYDLNGNQIKSYSIHESDEVLEIKAAELSPGIYLYSLMINGNIVDTKKMILTESY